STENIGADYVRAIGGRLLAGRDMTTADESRTQRIALVNQAFAKFYFADGNAVGKSFRMDDSIAVEIVGVMADVRDHELTGHPDRRAYFAYAPLDTAVSNPTELRFAVRTNGDPAHMFEPVRKVVIDIEPLLPI